METEALCFGGRATTRHLTFIRSFLGIFSVEGNKQSLGPYLLLSTFTLIPGSLLLLLTVSESTQQLKEFSEDLGSLVLLTQICVSPSLS